MHDSTAPFSLTVLTPTHNRAHRLPELYASLVRQADPRVRWLVVDDGSTDDTAAVVAAWIAEGTIPIHYVHKPNGGKHTALNAGIALIETRLTMIVDSDDHLTDDAVASIAALDARYAGRPELGGYAFTRVTPDGGALLAGPLPAPELVASYIDVRVNGDLDGDMAEVFRTEHLRTVPFPEFDGERFLAEDVVWIRMAFDRDLVFLDHPVYVCEYLPGGLTRTGRSLAVRAPRGAMARAQLLMDERIAVRWRLRGAALWVAYGRFAGIGILDLVHTGGHPWLCLVGLPLGLALHATWRRRYA